MTQDHLHSEDEHCVHVVTRDKLYRYECSAGCVGRWYQRRPLANVAAAGHVGYYNSTGAHTRIMWR